MSTIIKASGRPLADSSPVRQVAFNFSDMTRQAQEYLAEVRAQASQIVKDAEKQAQTIREQAEQQGRQAALQAVERVMDDKVAKHMKTLLPALELAVGEIQHARQEWLAHWQQSGVTLACAIARRIARRELKHTPEITLDWMAEALQLAAGSAEVTVRLHPTDLENLGEQVHEITKRLNPVAPAAVVADAAIESGGCRVETRFGAIDQQLETQLQRLEEELGE
jgi:flagellar biosynthesis/type III secretory pathway protein FliH